MHKDSGECAHIWCRVPAVRAQDSSLRVPLPKWRVWVDVLTRGVNLVVEGEALGERDAALLERDRAAGAAYDGHGAVGRVEVDDGLEPDRQALQQHLRDLQVVHARHQRARVDQSVEWWLVPRHVLQQLLRAPPRHQLRRHNRRRRLAGHAPQIVSIAHRKENAWEMGGKVTR
eukprot:1786837-Rhodomonas_salina.2